MNLDFTNYRTIGDVPFDVFQSQVTNSPMGPYAREIYDIVKGHSRLYLAQLWYESKYDNVRSRLKATDRNPTNMKFWPGDPRGNPRGMTGTKPTGVGGDPYLTFDSYANAAREWRRRVIDDAEYKAGVYTKVNDLLSYLMVYADIYEVHPDTGEDTTSILVEVPSKLVSLTYPEAIPVAKKYQIAVTDTKRMEVESEIPIVIALLPASQRNQRPGYAMTAIGITQHENSNPSHDANGELRYFRLGAEGRQASYHFVGDSNVIYQMVPIGENAWHSGDGGDGTGNRKTIAFSIAQGGPNFTKAWQGFAFFAGKLLKALGLPADRIYQHDTWTRKNCPEWIRNRGLWAAYKAALLVAYNAGGNVPPQPTYASKIVLQALQVTGPVAPRKMVLEDGTKCIWVGDRVRATKETRRYQWAGQKSPDVGPKLTVGEEFDVDWLFENSEGEWYYTPYDTRIFADDTVRISDAKGA